MLLSWWYTLLYQSHKIGRTQLWSLPWAGPVPEIVFCLQWNLIIYLSSLWVKLTNHQCSYSLSLSPHFIMCLICAYFLILLRYLSALLPEELDPTLENASNAGWPASVHIIGKVTFCAECWKEKSNIEDVDCCFLYFFQGYFEVSCSILAWNADVSRLSSSRSCIWAWFFDKGKATLVTDIWVAFFLCYSPLMSYCKQYSLSGVLGHYNFFRDVSYFHLFFEWRSSCFLAH